jgi:putative peptidoglycan lipid II flippase
MVDNFLKKGIKAFSSKQTNIFSAAFFISLTTVFSQILGFLKYRFLVTVFGASSDLGVFFAAFKIPDLLFQVLIAGALSSAFIPIFSEYISKEKDKEAHVFTSALVTIGLTAFLVISVIMSIFSYQLSSLIAPGFSPSQLNLMSNLTRIILFAQVFFVLGTVATGVLQSYRHFLIPGIASAFYNLGIIIGLFAFGRLSEYMEPQLESLSDHCFSF